MKITLNINTTETYTSKHNLHDFLNMIIEEITEGVENHPGMSYRGAGSLQSVQYNFELEK